MADPELRPSTLLQALVRFELGAYCNRAGVLPERVNAEPAWRIVLCAAAAPDGPLSQEALPQALGLSSESVRRWVALLEKEGLLERRGAVPPKISLAPTTLMSLEKYYCAVLASERSVSGSLATRC